MATATNLTAFTIAKPNYGFKIRYTKKLSKAATFVAIHFFAKQKFKIIYNHQHV